MPNVEIGIFNIGRTTVDPDEVQRWMDYLGADEYVIPDVASVSSPALLVSLAAKRCYMSFQPGLNPNVNRVRKDMVEYFDNILKSGHGSVLEHSVYNFAIEGVSRVFTAEMNRHRAGWAISEGSLRYIRFDKDLSWWLPDSLRPNSHDDADLAERKRRTVEIFTATFKDQEKAYAELLKVWDIDAAHHNFHYKKVVTSCLRRIVGMGVATGGVWSGNLRALRHVIALRTADGAEEEIFHVFRRIGLIMMEKEPLIFGDFAEKLSADSGPSGLEPKYRKV